MLSESILFFLFSKKGKRITDLMGSEQELFFAERGGP